MPSGTLSPSQSSVEGSCLCFQLYIFVASPAETGQVLITSPSRRLHLPQAPGPQVAAAATTAAAAPPVTPPGSPSPSAPAAASSPHSPPDGCTQHATPTPEGRNTSSTVAYPSRSGNPAAAAVAATAGRVAAAASRAQGGPIGSSRPSSSSRGKYSPASCAQDAAFTRRYAGRV